ncbi:hypothetical protein [Gracilinema caldarium]|uniref:Uncharacterized protein n=1 Tax=Gracilinema caldarium (strain ATCC 51460 / DSM 7334 / H1) TaxID=744872 RepID=F8F4C4_GRAC1|nr:hypothetical protein [Gracilinema caldarium]AEJ20571.1 hypothetical protein Spica_2466 [Gracilinema caldarium DSM 7334]
MKASVLVIAALGAVYVLSCTGTPTSASFTISTATTKQNQDQTKPAQPAQTGPSEKDGIITFNQGGQLPKGLTMPAETYLKEGEVFVPAYAPDRFEGNWGIGKILTPASAKTKGEAEVLQFYDNKSFWISANWVITKSRPAVAEELQEGMLVLCGKIDDAGRRSYDTWFLGVIKSTDTLYKNEVRLERYPHDAKAVQFSKKVSDIRIIIEPVLKFKKVGSNYMKLP